MDKVFVDSNAFIALNNSSDKLHKRAAQISKILFKNNVSLFTATNILLETATILSQRLSHNKAIEFLEFVRKGNIAVIHPTEDSIFDAEEIFKKQKSKNVSYSDCVSFAVMREINILYAFSFDRDFKTNGFKLI